MALFMRKTLLALKEEATPGTEETLTGTECFLVRNVTLTPLAGSTATRDFIRPYFGNSSTIQLDQHYEVQFEVELQSSGAAGTRPAFGDALICSAMSETVTPSTKVEYKPVSDPAVPGDPLPSATIAVYMDGILHTMVGSVGTWSLNLARGALPTINFTFWGSYVAPEDATPLTPVFTDFKVPLGANSLNTQTVTLFGQALCMESFSFDIANNLVFRDLPGCDPLAMVTNRAPSGSIQFQLTPVATYAWVEAARAKTSGALAIQHGTSAGYIVGINAPAVTLNPPSYADSDGILMLNAPLVFEPTSSGNNEVVLTFK